MEGLVSTKETNGMENQLKSRDREWLGENVKTSIQDAATHS